MLINKLQLILNCKKVHSNLSISFIQEEVEKVFVGDLLPLRETIANPAFGFFADKAGLTYNMRFFSPYIKACFDDKNKREYIKDTSLDSITSLFIELFPSPTGQLTVSTSGTSNPSNLFNTNKEDSVKLFARLFTAILKDENFDSFKFNRNENKVKETDKDFANRKALFNYMKKKLFAENSNSIYKDKTIKLLLIQSYMVNVLDPKYAGDNKNYFELYLNEIADSYKSYLNEFAKSKLSKINKFLEIKIDNEVLESSVRYCDSMNSFPYSRLNKPESTRYIPTFIRDDKNEKDGGKFDEDNKFPDCADIALLHLCNCLFFFKGDFERDYTLDHLPNTRSKHLTNFYEKYKKITTLTLEIRKEWSKVVQDLNNLEISDMDSNYPTDYISYVKDTNNEIFPGIINMMNVLIRITGLNPKEIFPTDFTHENLEKSLIKLIEKISVKENGKSVARLNINPSSLQENYFKKKKDFKGTFTINFRYDDKTNEDIVVYQGQRHATVELPNEKLKTFFTDTEKTNLKSKLATLSYQDLMFKCLLFPADINLKWENEICLQKIYLSGRIDNDSSSFNILMKICKFIDSLNDPNNIEIHEKIMIQILNKVELSDEGTRWKFRQFLCFKRSALENNALLAISGYEYRFNTDSPFLIRKWEELFSNSIPEFKFIDLNYFSEFESFLNLIGKFSNVEELKITNSQINESQLVKIINSLKNPEKLLKLNLSGSYELKNIPEQIRKLTKLNCLDLFSCRMHSIPAPISDLDSLEELNMNFNRIKYFSGKSLRNIKKLNLCQNSISDDFLEQLFECTSFEDIDLSYNSISKLPKSIKNLKNLKVLNLEENQIDDVPIEFNELNNLERINFNSNNFAKISPAIFQNFSQLKILDLNFCSISNHFLKELFKFINPEELDISGNKICELPEEIENLSKLTVLNLFLNKIHDLPLGLKKIVPLTTIYLNTNIVSEETQKRFNGQLFDLIF